MEKNSVAEALNALATSNENRSQTARLRDVFDEVENALKAGVRREIVLQSLNDNGLSMNMKSFESAIYRLRKERKNNSGLYNPNEKKNQNSNKSTATETPGNVVAETSILQNSEQSVSNDDENLDGLSMREKRERRASQFIKEAPSNPLLKNLKGK